MVADTSTRRDDPHAVGQAPLERSHRADKTKRGLAESLLNCACRRRSVASCVQFCDPMDYSTSGSSVSGSSGAYSNACPRSQ